MSRLQMKGFSRSCFQTHNIKKNSVFGNACSSITRGFIMEVEFLVFAGIGQISYITTNCGRVQSISSKCMKMCGIDCANRNKKKG